MEQACILVVDDNRANRVVLEKRLSREGYRVEAADGGEAALQCLGLDGATDGGIELDAFDAVVLDIMMPEIDGLEVLRRIRERKSANDLPVVMATAKDQTEDIVAALAMGANDYVVKPINMPVLLGRLRTQISLKKTHSALKEAQASLIEAARMESVGYLAAGVAHEVRNPLAQIQMGVDAIARSASVQSDASLAPVIELVSRGVEKADSIIRELMKVSMSGQLVLQPSSVNDLVRDVMGSVEAVSKESRVELEINLEESLPPIPIAMTEMRQALSHVVRNALEAMPRGGVLTVRTGSTSIDETASPASSRSGKRLRPGDEVIFIEVADTGPGIPEADLEKVFDSFFTTKATGEGTGLGLSVARKVADLHHGSISVGNRKDGSGTRAVIWLPSGNSMGTLV